MTEALQPKLTTKSGTLKARKHVMCDGSFVADLLACGYFARVDAAAYPLVGRPIIKHSPLTLPISSRPMTPKGWRDMAGWMSLASSRLVGGVIGSRPLATPTQLPASRRVRRRCCLRRGRLPKAPGKTRGLHPSPCVSCCNQ